MKRFPVLVALVLCTALPAAGQVIIDPTITGSSVSLSISAPLGIGLDVTLGFEEVSGLSLANLGLSAQVVNPLDPALLARLPQGVVISAVPIVLRIEPPASGGLSFEGVATLDVHTHNLLYLPGSPLRLFSAQIGGPFEDVTVAMGPGSYRTRANRGGFSEFIIVLDLRSQSQVIAHKFNRLEAMLDAYEGSMPGSIYDDLEEHLEDARAEYNSGDKQGAIAELDAFLAIVDQHAGTDIPNVWRAARDVHNVAGYLEAGATTLRFSLGLKSLGLLGL